jgi:hypothetical protein
MGKPAMLALMAVLAASRAAAQPAPWQPERLTAGWTVTPGMMFGAAWDTNPTMRNESGPFHEGVVSLVNPRGEIDFNGRRTHFNVGYSGTLQTYQTLEALTHFSQHGRMLTRYQASQRLNFITTATFASAPTTDEIELDGIPFVRVGSKKFDAVGGFAYQLTPRTVIAGGYTFQWVHFERDVQQRAFQFLRGGYSHKPTLRLNHRLTDRISVGGNWDYRRAVVDAGAQTFEGQEAIGDISWKVGPHTSITGGAGVSYLRIASTEVKRVGPAYRASLAQELFRASLTASYERSFVPNFAWGGLTSSESLRAGVTMPLLHGRMTASGSISYRRTNPLIVEVDLVELNSIWTNFALSFAATRWLRVEGFFLDTHQTSNARGVFDRIRTGVQFGISKPMRMQ